MGDEKSFLTLSRSGIACGVEQMEKWVERSTYEDDSLDCLMLPISTDSVSIGLLEVG